MNIFFSIKIPNGSNRKYQQNLLSPFNAETAIKKVRLAENAWNTKDPVLYHLPIQKIVFGETEANLLEVEKKL